MPKILPTFALGAALLSIGCQPRSVILSEMPQPEAGLEEGDTMGAVTLLDGEVDVIMWTREAFYGVPNPTVEAFASFEFPEGVPDGWNLTMRFDPSLDDTEGATLLVENLCEGDGDPSDDDNLECMGDILAGWRAYCWSFWYLDQWLDDNTDLGPDARREECHEFIEELDVPQNPHDG